ncbi:MAG: hydrogenase maturation protease [Anaerolineae bacterium]|nr:hydrogenase maturation protease [Anaerolineae bacterium]NUQ03510.1 hydrogenase maturation protease [Anaerolineae bacterium]
MRLVIGYGSLVRGDDAIGQIVAEALRERLSDAEIIAVTQLTPELAEPLSRAEKAFFIDAAVCQGEAPGSIRIQQVEQDRAGGAFSHNVTPARLLTAAEVLYGSAPPTRLITITAESFAVADTLSPALHAALPAVLTLAEAHIRE